MPEDYSCVFVVDDDRTMRESLSNLLRSAGLNVQTFASAHEFLTRQRPKAPSCLVLDVQLPGLNGLPEDARHAHASRSDTSRDR
jgi:FixJ family two-component response regulator